MSQVQLANAAGVPQSTVARIETGAIDPKVITFEKLLRACSMKLQTEPLLGRGVDRSQIRRILALSPQQRIDEAAAAARNLNDFLSKLSAGRSRGARSG